MQSFDCAIIGTGPAGMSAALRLSELGATVAVLDRAPSPGGQIYRAVAQSPLATPDKLGADYLSGADLVSAFSKSNVAWMPGADVWHLGDDGRIFYSQDNRTQELQCRQMLICPGAMERPMPIPGWTLPGVMTAGSAQVMLKSDAMAISDAIFAGSGPLLYLIVAQYLRLGIPIAGVVDTTPRQNYVAALPMLASALRQVGMLFKGLGLLREIQKSKVPFYRFATDLEVVGTDHAQGLRFQQDGASYELSGDAVLLHHGVVPNLNLARSIGLDHVFEPDQLAWRVKTSPFGQTSCPHIWVAGDGAGIVGANGAKHAGELAALGIGCELGLLDDVGRDQLAEAPRKASAGQSGFRRFIDRLYQPAPDLMLPTRDDTIVCRCEEQSLWDLRQGFQSGARDPNALKSLTRCGMGPCQGRQCGHIVSGLLAKWREEPVADVGYYRLRSPLRLLTLEELARLQDGESAR